MNLIYVRDGTIQPFGLGLAVFMAMFIWFGATQALVVAKLRERIPGLSARTNDPPGDQRRGPHPAGRGAAPGARGERARHRVWWTATTSRPAW